VKVGGKEDDSISQADADWGEDDDLDDLLND